MYGSVGLCIWRSCNHVLPSIVGHFWSCDMSYISGRSLCNLADKQCSKRRRKSDPCPICRI